MNKVSIISKTNNIAKNLQKEINNFEFYVFDNCDKLFNYEITPNIVIIALNTFHKSFKSFKLIKRYYNNIKVVVACKLNYKSNIHELIQYNVDGFIFLPLDVNEVKECLNNVTLNKKFYSLSFPSITIPLMIKENNQESNYKLIDNLTRKEILILKLITEEYTNPDIAKKLKLSNRTIDSHRRNLLKKIGVKNTAGLVKFACRIKLCE